MVTLLLQVCLKERLVDTEAGSTNKSSSARPKLPVSPRLRYEVAMKVTVQR